MISSTHQKHTVVFFKYITAFLLLLSSKGFSQLVVNENVGLQDLISSIIGPGYTVSNIKLNCAQGAFATFTSAGSNLGINNGVLLTNGKASYAIGPNDNVSISFTNGTPGDVQLDDLLPKSLELKTSDGCSVEFDLVPSCDTLKIRYVFGSEEYMEYVNTEFNDVFGFFISGPGINGIQNIATVPNSNTPVSINTINDKTNRQYFVDNDRGTSIQYDGFTRPMTAWAPVIPCSTYHLKIVIADTGDPIFDSGVFIEGGSINCSPVVYNNVATNINGVRGCKNGSFTFCRTGDRANAFVVDYTVGGTAVNGVDYQTLSGKATIPAGQECVTVEVVPLPSTAKPTKTIEITYEFGACPLSNTITLTISDPIPLNAGPDKEICSGDSITIGFRDVSSTAYEWIPATGLSNPNVANPKVSLQNNTTVDQKYTYVVKATSPLNGCVVSDSVNVTVKPHPTAVFYIKNPSHCLGGTTFFRDTSVALAGRTLVKWYWDFGNDLFDTIKHASTVYPNAGHYTVKHVVTDDRGCTDDTTLTLDVWPLPKVDFDVVSACVGDSVSFKNLSTVDGGTIKHSIWDFGDSTTQNTIDAKHLYSLTGKKNFDVKLFIVTDKDCSGILSLPVEIFPKPTVAFDANSGCVYKGLRFNNYSDGNKFIWTFGDGATSTVRNPVHVYSTTGQKDVTLIVENNYGCKDTLPKKIDVFPLPKFDFFASDTAGCPVFTPKFTGVADPSTIDSIISWKWIFNPSNIKYGQKVEGIPLEELGMYSPMLIATTSKGCSDTVTKQNYIHVYPLPQPVFTLSPAELSIYDMKTQIIDNSSSDVVKWDWDLGDGIKELDKKRFPHDYTGGTKPFYTVTLQVTNQFGCKNSTFRNIYVRTEKAVFIPNAFTPNGDGLNDKFFPVAVGEYLNADYQMRIFDRWGNKLLFSGDINESWDGTYKGSLCERDVYVYSIIFKNKEDNSVMARFRGIVTLVQ